jgi:hypothetical protein
VVLEARRDKIFDWAPGYSQSSKEPMGCSALYDLLPGLFPSGEFIKSNRDLYTFIGSNNDTNCNLIVITDVFDLDRSAGNRLVDWISLGNNAFISAGSSSESFCDVGGFEETVPAYGMYLNSKPDTSTGRLYYFLNEPDPYYLPGPWATAVLSADSAAMCDTLMMAQDNYNALNPMFLQLRIGSGSLFIHGAPYLFSNYVMHDAVALQLAEKTLLTLPDAKTYWDEYYKPGNRQQSGDGMNIIFERASLKAAWQLLILLMLLYIVFAGKRQQKAIPVIEPPVNTSAEYIRTLGRLYFEKRNNRDILNKRLHFLLMTIRLKFSIDLKPDDPQFVRSLMMATGAAESEIKKIAWCFNAVRNEEPDSAMTLKISREIDLFYKKYIN